MRRLAPIGLLIFGCFLFASATASAEALSDPDAPPVPTAADVIAQLYQFDLFQQNAVERTENAPSSDVLTTAGARADAAAKRDKALAALQRQTGTEVPAPHKAAAMRAHSVEAVDRTDGPAYVRQFYAAQLVEYELTVALIEQYLQSPDNEDIRSFASDQLPILRTELADTRTALADK